ncbi:MAG: hypothetical protein K0R00_1458 [Herbinix sp.]|jgi:thiamine biosynthesis lipoprotein|nr:hypothetical protein [Herbinix sp.]
MKNRLFLTMGTRRISQKLLILTLFLAIFFSGCSKFTPGDSVDQGEKEYITRTELLLSTVVTINLYDKQDQDILDGCFELIAKYEEVFSRTSETSELYALNHRLLPQVNGAYQISEDLTDIIKKAIYYGDVSEGGFDISIEPVSSIWDFLSDPPVIPTEQQLEKALPLVNYKYIYLKDKTVSFENDEVRLDLGGIAKGYIADRVKEYLKSQGVESAIINLGGNVLCVGNKPDGSPFHIGIQKPFADRNETVAVMDISDLSVGSSGIYERFFEKDDIIYHHILDTKTGYPIQNGLLSVTILSKYSVDGEGLSKTCFHLGLEKGLEFIETLPDTYAVFITADDQIYYSKGFKDAIKVTDKED